MKGRLAPSPTGGLHLGHARTFLAAWLLARGEGGAVVLRVEDLDAGRARPETVIDALTDLAWLGLNWDEGPDVGGPSGPYMQSERFDLYEATLGRLKDAELVYPCTCTRAEIARTASAPHAEDEGPTYPGTCAGRSTADARSLESRGFAWRFRVPPGPVAWDDLFGGRLEIDLSRAGGDFLVAREGPGAAYGYQLAVVADDAAMGVTQVVRGLDLVPSTPRQILLYRALGLTPPAFGHITLVVGSDGRRLAKRDDSLKLSTLRESGVDPRALVGWLGLSLGLSETQKPSLPTDWLGRLRPELVPENSWVVHPEGINALLASRPLS